MIFDTLQNRHIYRGLGDRFDLAFKAIEDGISDRPDGNYELAGKDVFAMVQRYQTKEPSKGKWEAHRKYIDVQYIASGVERMGWELISEMNVSEPYDAKRDVEFFTSSRAGNIITMRAGLFAIFFPQDVHMPSLMAEQSNPVCKTVVKIAIE